MTPRSALFDRRRRYGNVASLCLIYWLFHVSTPSSTNYLIRSGISFFIHSAFLCTVSAEYLAILFRGANQSDEMIAAVLATLCALLAVSLNALQAVIYACQSQLGDCLWAELRCYILLTPIIDWFVAFTFDVTPNHFVVRFPAIVDDHDQPHENQNQQQPVELFVWYKCDMLIRLPANNLPQVQLIIEFPVDSEMSEIDKLPAWIAMKMNELADAAA